MIRRLRHRLVAVTMILLTLVLVLALCLLMSSVYRVMENDSLDALQDAGIRYGLHIKHPEGDEAPPEKPDREDGKAPEEEIGPEKKSKKPGDKQIPPIPCFVVGYDHEGQLYANGPGYYDLTDRNYLEQLLQLASETQLDHGILLTEQMRFLKLDDICGDAFAFTDISSELGALMNLMYRYVLVGILAMGAFFLIALLTSRWAVRPVERVMNQQRQFVADASHELKTPLTVILTNAELLSSGEYPEDEQKKFTGNILTMTRQMRGLVEELLDLARVDSGQSAVRPEKLNFSQLVSDGALPFESVYFEAGRILDIRIDPGIEVWGNPEALMRVVDILLDNGCKYSRTGSTVTLHLHRRGLASCQLTVKSEGDTLTKQECRDIFKRFYRRDTTRTMSRSYGLGLSIARNIIRQHKGKIWARSKDGTNIFDIHLSTARSGKQAKTRREQNL